MSDGALVTTRDSGTDAAMGRDASSDAVRPLTCPPRTYLNVVRKVCVPAHDLNGDGRVDLLGVNTASIQAMLSDGTSFTEAPAPDGGFYAEGGRLRRTSSATVMPRGSLHHGLRWSGPYRRPRFGNVVDNFGVWLL